MPRTPRRCQWTEEACYHLMGRGHNREMIFVDDEDRRAFLYDAGLAAESPLWRRVAWLDAFAARVPAFAATKPPG